MCFAWREGQLFAMVSWWGAWVQSCHRRPCSCCRSRSRVRRRTHCRFRGQSRFRFLGQSRHRRRCRKEACTRLVWLWF